MEHDLIMDKLFELNSKMRKRFQNGLPGVTINKGPVDWQIIQRDASGFGQITLEGTYIAIGTDISVRFRVVHEDNGAPVSKGLDWMDADLDPTEKTFKITINQIPQGGLYRIESGIRRTHSDSRMMRGDYIHHIGVGDIYVIAGQSNASGTGKGEAFDPPILGVHVFGNDERWKLATHPLEDATGTLHPITITGIFHGTSPWLSYGRNMFMKTGVPIGLIPTALGGSSISLWIDESLEPAELFVNMYDMIRKAGGNVAGVLWYQGESDCPFTHSDSADIYRQKFIRFVDLIRALTRNPNLPVFTAQLSRYANTDWPTFDFSEMRELQRQIAKNNEKVFMIVTVDLPMSDGIHISGIGNKILGERFADAALTELFGYSIEWRFPDVKRARFTDSTYTCIRVEFEHIQGDLTPGMCVSDFTVTMSGTAIGITSAVPQRDNTVLIKLTKSAGKSAVLHCLQGQNPAANLRDDGGRCLTPSSVMIE